MKNRMDELRDDILDRLLRFVAWAGLVAYVPSAIMAAVESLWAIVVIDTFAYFSVAAIGFVPRIPFNMRLAIGVGNAMLVGAVVLVYTGPLGAGYIWFMVAVVLSALFGRMRIVVLTIAASMAFMVAWAFALSAGLEGNGATPVIVAIVAVSLFVACALLAFVIQNLLRSLGSALDESRGLAATLAAELDASKAVRAELESTMLLKDGLLHELQHRVRNNMQVVQSLLAVNDGGKAAIPGEMAAVRRRVQALSAVNDLYLSSPGGAAVDASELIRTIAHGIGRCEDDGDWYLGKSGSVRAAFDPQVAGLVAIILGDAVEVMLRWGYRASLYLKAVNSGLRIELRVPVQDGLVAIAPVFKELLDDRITHGAAPEVTLGLLEASGEAGPGLYIEAATEPTPA